MTLQETTETTSGHGRVEKRTCWQTDYPDWFQEKKALTWNAEKLLQALLAA